MPREPGAPMSLFGVLGGPGGPDPNALNKKISVIFSKATHHQSDAKKETEGDRRRCVYRTRKETERGLICDREGDLHAFSIHFIYGFIRV